MSTYAKSYLIRGASIEFVKTPIVNKLNRFDTKTGFPTIVDSHSFHIVAKLTDGTEIALPEDTECFGDRYGEATWKEGQAVKRIEQWFNQYDIGNEESKVKQYSSGGYPDDIYIIGAYVATGHNYHNPIMNVGDTEFDEQECFDITLNDKLCVMFDCADLRFLIGLYLITKLGE